jgi:hypothetical protein
VKALDNFQRLAEGVNDRLSRYDYDEIIQVSAMNAIGLRQRFVMMVVADDFRKGLKVLDWGDFQKLHDDLIDIDIKSELISLVPMVILGARKTRLRRLSEKEAMLYML